MGGGGKGAERDRSFHSVGGSHKSSVWSITRRGGLPNEGQKLLMDDPGKAMSEKVSIFINIVLTLIAVYFMFVLLVLQYVRLFFQSDELL